MEDNNKLDIAPEYIPPKTPLPENKIYSEKKGCILQRLTPSIRFYCKLVQVVLKGGRLAKNNQYNKNEWKKSSYELFKHLEELGVRMEIEGLENIKNTEGPVVFVGNHMSMIDTSILPWTIQSFKDTTFVLKESLANYPIFGNMIKAIEPITVTRTNVRKDLSDVLKTKLIENNTSVIIFPQGTRKEIFNPKEMNSLGVKLAKKNKVSVIPIAIKTDCLSGGRFSKDFGKIDLEKDIHISFGDPVNPNEPNAQKKINKFILDKLKAWGCKVKEEESASKN